eukprot:TRINITY_DN3632_c0_g1_i2.p1 TRINITY_DN3632_c0_g1~~TRINITY_DN3632_c0_g1_i2.p1  ORF type:complete len:879 (-),score=193.80 TRINITY_DN3632_c0_g1_i2:52-2688(-)
MLEAPRTSLPWTLWITIMCTQVAEYAIALSAKHMTRTVYTSPIKALSNQKFRDFKETFGDVGLVTGDVSINPEASCLIVTTEILRSMLYRGADIIRDIEWVIFDEVHYVNDAERGVVWEEVIIMLPEHVNIILLSATVPNALEFADWIGRTKQKKIYVISTAKRPVPLEHFLYFDGASELYKVVDSQRKFLNVGYTAALTAHRKPANSKKVGLPSTKGTWVKLTNFLKTQSLLPVVVFTFSKKKCQEYADALSSADFTLGAHEKSEIHVFIENSLARLKEIDRTLPQIIRMKELIKRGIGVHHGGLLPIVKEMVEIMFGRGLIRVLFATETFAMGVNMPARTVVFSNLRKHDGIKFRDLRPGEYTQMSGRAGRRGKDPVGTVIVNCNSDIPEASTLNAVILGTPTKLESQFRLTFNMILNLLRIEDLKVEEMMKRSFAESVGQRMLPKQQALLDHSASLLAALKPPTCPNKMCDIPAMYEAFASYQRLEKRYRGYLIDTPLMRPGRVVLLEHPMKYPAPTYAVIISVNTTTTPARLLAVPAHSCSNSDGGACAVWIKPSAVASLTKMIMQVELGLVSGLVREGAMVDKLATQLHSLASRKTAATNLATVDPFSNAKQLPIEFHELETERETARARFDAEVRASSCPLAQCHLRAAHTAAALRSRSTRLGAAISDGALQLMPDFQARISVLRTLRYIDDENAVLLKGRVAREINTVDSLIATELIFDNVITELDPTEMVALLSVLVFQEKNTDSTNFDFPPRLQPIADALVNTAVAVAKAQQKCGMQIDERDYVKSALHFGVFEVVYEWARQTPFRDICRLTEVQEGSIVRCITRLDESCKEIRNAARIIGDPVLFAKSEEGSRLIKRDIVFASSLYVA